MIYNNMYRYYYTYIQMIETKTISTRIILHPKCISSLIKVHIENTVKELLVDKCFKNEGYILNLDKIVSINNTMETTFYVTSLVSVFKPCLNTEYDAIVSMVYKDGIFAVIHNIQKILIPVVNGYIFNTQTNEFINSGTTIGIDSVIKVKITAIKYSKTRFSCIGVLIQ